MITRDVAVNVVEEIGCAKYCDVDADVAAHTVYGLRMDIYGERLVRRASLPARHLERIWLASLYPLSFPFFPHSGPCGSAAFTARSIKSMPGGGESGRGST